MISLQTCTDKLIDSYIVSKVTTVILDSIPVIGELENRLQYIEINRYNLKENSLKTELL